MRVVALSGLVCLAVGCGAVTPPTSPAASVTLASMATTTVASGQSRVSIGRTEQMSAAVTASTGSIDSAPTGTWGTDAPGVATVSQAGLVTTISPGDVTIFFDSAAGTRGTKHLTVIGDFNGTWSGMYQLSGCTDTGDFAGSGFCSTFTSGLSGPYIVTMKQTNGVVDASWELASSTYRFASANGAVGGAFGSNTEPTGAGGDFTFGAVAGFQLSQSGVSQIGGTVQCTITNPRMSGSGRFTGRITSSTRVADWSPTPLFNSGRVSPSSFSEIRTALALR